jgi:hypothetical protein
MNVLNMSSSSTNTDNKIKSCNISPERHLHYYENGILHIDTYYKNGINCNYCKEYNSDGLLIYHIVYHDYKFTSESIFNAPNDNRKNRPNELHAQYVNGKLCYFGILSNIHCSSPHSKGYRSLMIYRISENFVCIDLSIINPIRSLQKRFRKKFNSKRSTILNQFLINDVSQLIISYLKN